MICNIPSWCFKYICRSSQKNFMNGEILLWSASDIVEIKSLFSSILTGREDIEISSYNCLICFLRFLFLILCGCIVSFNLSYDIFQIGAFSLARIVVIFAFWFTCFLEFAIFVFSKFLHWSHNVDWDKIGQYLNAKKLYWDYD